MSIKKVNHFTCVNIKNVIKKYKDMKLKIVEFNRVEKETEIDLPIYLSFQDEDCNDELIMVDEKYQITIKHNHFGYDIKKTCLVMNVEEYHLKSLTTKEHFQEMMSFALMDLGEHGK